MGDGPPSGERPGHAAQRFGARKRGPGPGPSPVGPGDKRQRGSRGRCPGESAAFGVGCRCKVTREPAAAGAPPARWKGLVRSRACLRSRQRLSASAPGEPLGSDGRVGTATWARSPKRSRGVIGKLADGERSPCAADTLLVGRGPSKQEVGARERSESDAWASWVGCAGVMSV